MRHLFMNGKRWKVLSIMTLPYPLGIPPVLIANVDFIFILREHDMGNRTRIYENYASMFATFEEFSS